MKKAKIIIPLFSSVVLVALPIITLISFSYVNSHPAVSPIISAIASVSIIATFALYLPSAIVFLSRGMICKDLASPDCIRLSHEPSWLYPTHMLVLSVGCVVFYVSLVYAFCVLKENIHVGWQGNRVRISLISGRTVFIAWLIPIVIFVLELVILILPEK